MTTLSLDFNDASFDGNDAFIIDDSNNLVYEMNKDGTTGDQLVSKGTGQNVSNGTGIGAVSAMALSAPAGTTFDFEFIDDPENTNSGEGVRSPGDRYASNSNLDGGVTFFMNEAMFESGLDITNGDVMPIAQTEVERSSPTPATIGDTVDGDVSGTLEHDAEGGVWILDVAGGAYKTGDWADIMGALPSTATINGASVQSVSEAGVKEAIEATAFEAITTSYNIGDGNGETWVVSGDFSGRTPDGSGSDDIIGFRPGYYDGVFLGGLGFDTLRFDHNLVEDARMYVDLSGGVAMFGNGQASPLVQFADIGKGSYSLDWERLELSGESNDTVVVGAGIGMADSNEALASSTGAIVDGFFELSLGAGEDQVFVNDVDTAITLDLSGSSYSYVGVVGEDSDSTDALSMVGAYTSGEDADGHDVFGSIEVTGNGNGGAIDYINAGDDNEVYAFTRGDYGTVFNMGLDTGEDGSDYLDSGAENDALDLRGMDSVMISGEDGFIHVEVSETVGSGPSAQEMTANIYGEDVEAIFVTQDGNDGDTDVLVNMSHLYGEDSGILGMGTDDVSGGNFDVVTSAKLDGFAGEDDLQIYYDGDHNAFVDSQDHMTWSTDEGTNVATSEVNTEQRAWADAVEKNDSGGAATPSFYVEVAGEKVAVYLDQTDAAAEWKVDTSAFAITTDATIGGEDDGSIITEMSEAYGLTISGEDIAEASNIYLNASETDIQDLLEADNTANELSNVMSDSAYTLASTLR